jgi:hypothetical protein
LYSERGRAPVVDERAVLEFDAAATKEPAIVERQQFFRAAVEAARRLTRVAVRRHLDLVAVAVDGGEVVAVPCSESDLVDPPEVDLEPLATVTRRAASWTRASW